ncbi:MAG: GyrI-like domain-containing protein [Xanthobacteraceae bacterium]|jgi:GyrI-like small molecule binding domain
MSKPGECTIVTVERQLTAVVESKVPMAEIPQAERSARTKLDAAVRSLDVGPLGQTFTLWRPPTDGRLDMQPGIVVSRAFAPLGEVVPSALPAGRTAHLLLTGPYDGIPGAWNRLFAWCAGERLTLAGTNWQIYGDENDDPAKLTTSMYAPLA